MAETAMDVRDVAPARQPVSLLLCGALGLCLFIIVYASLLPFEGWMVPDSFSLKMWSRAHQSSLDLLLNVAAYIPLGLLLAELLREAGHRHPLRRVVVLAAALSLAMELLQIFLPGRVTAWHDWAANTLGAFAGAALTLSPPGRRVAAKLLQLRREWMVHHPHAEVGALLLLVWFIAQSNPAVPFFEAGQLVNDLVRSWQEQSPDGWTLLPQIVAIALNVCGFALFVSVWISQRIFAGIPVVLALGAGLLVKFLAAGLLLKAPLMDDWFGPASVLGLLAGYFLALLLLGARARTRLFLALLLIFAGALMARIAGIYDGFDGMLRLFDRPHGQLGTFAGVTRWLNELWPLAVFAYLAVLFIQGHATQVKSGARGSG